MPVGARQSRRQFRRVIITVDPPVPVAGWVPPRNVARPPEPPPQNGRLYRTAHPTIHPNFTDFVLQCSRLISSPQYEPPNGSLFRSQVPLQDLVPMPIMQARRMLGSHVTRPDLNGLLGCVKRTLNPQRLYLRRLLTPPYCWTGQVFSPGAVAGELHTPGAAAGQTGCGD